MLLHMLLVLARLSVVFKKGQPVSLYPITQNVHARRGGTGDSKWDLGEHIMQHKSAKYSSNFTPEWIKTWPFISAGDSTNRMVSI